MLFKYRNTGKIYLGVIVTILGLLRLSGNGVGFVPLDAAADTRTESQKFLRRQRLSCSADISAAFCPLSFIYIHIINYALR